MKTSAVISALRALFSTHGVPDVIASDNRTAFTSEEMQAFLKLNGIRSVFTAPYHPSSNGRAERMVREVKEALKKQSGNDTQCKISRFLFKQHTTPHSETGKSPAEMMMGRKLRLALYKMHPLRQHSTLDTTAKGFRVGDSVYTRSFAAGPRWKLAEVIKVKGPVSYLVRMANGDVHQLRRAWPTEKPSEPPPDYHFRLPPVQTPVDMEPGITSPSHLYTPEGPELRRSARTRRPVVRFGSSV